MSALETVSDVENAFLSRRELVCNFAGLGGRLKKLEAVEMVSKKFGLDGKLVIPIRLRNHVGKTLVTGTFFVYEDKALAKKHVNPTVFERLEKARAAESKDAGESDSRDATDAAADDSEVAAASSDDKGDAASDEAPKPDAEAAS